MTTSRLFSATVGLLLVVSLAGCTGSESQPLPRPTAAPSGEGDCSGSIRFRGHHYRAHNALNQQAPRGRLLGVGDVVGCGWRTATPVDRVKVYAVSGVDTSVAVMTPTLTGERPTWPQVRVRRPEATLTFALTSEAPNIILRGR